MMDIACLILSDNQNYEAVSVLVWYCMNERRNVVH